MDPKSTYIKLPPYFENMSKMAAPLADLHGARVLAVLGDSITTDIFRLPAQSRRNRRLGKYLIANGVKPHDFNSYGRAARQS